MMTDQDTANIRFNVLRNAHYHLARRRSFERINRIFNFLVVILGTAAFGDLFAGLNFKAEWLGAAIATIGALQLVFDFGRQARDHQALQSSYLHLLADIEMSVQPAAAQIAKWRSSMIQITADEPPVLRAIDAKAYNDTIGAMDIDLGERLHIPFWQKPLRGFLAYEGYTYEKLNELDERKWLGK